MEFKYIAINGDNVGEGIGNAIATDNHEELSKLTGGLKEAHSAIEEWATSKGGKVITSSGDECIVKIPADSFDEAELDSVKESYSDTSGHTVTIGCGDSMSEASKALIYGKMNDKDQVVEYDSSIDDYIADYDDSEESSDEEYEESSEEAEEAELSPDEEAEEAEYNENSFDSEDELSYDMDETSEEDNADFIPENEEMALQGETSNEETDEDLMDEGSLSEEDMEQSTEDKLSEFTEDGDTEEIEAPADQLDGDYESEEMKDAQPEHELGMDEEEEFIHDAEENRDDELDEDNIEADEEGVMEEGSSDQSYLEDMIHANMEEDSEEGEPDTGELKNRIAQILISFKENKTVLEQMRQTNPVMYESSIAMLDSMIEMGKMLNMNPEADAEAMMAQEAMPDADTEYSDEEYEGSSEEMDLDEEPKEEEELVKKN